jgi:hypothetical protein
MPWWPKPDGSGRGRHNVRPVLRSIRHPLLLASAACLFVIFATSAVVHATGADAAADAAPPGGAASEAQRLIMQLGPPTTQQPPCLAQATTAAPAAASVARVPAVLHRSWKTAEVPSRFSPFVESWRRHHPRWRHILWSDEDNRALASSSPEGCRLQCVHGCCRLRC